MGVVKQKNTIKSKFSLEGRFVGFVGDFGKQPKRILVATSDGERNIKLLKKLRGSVVEVLEPGDWVQISGKQKYKRKTGKLKLKAHQLQSMAPVQPKKVSSPKTAAPKPKTKACVMVCQKSSCRKRGGRKVSQSVTEYLRDRGWENQVTIKGTGCMKQCKKGPCVVFMPDKSRYLHVDPKQVPTLMEKHFSQKVVS
ncbi:MAG: (2Fe-2S) ferredoxin domain-containing protein [Symploca sp. SIO1B1]|nr:(2Fe-2S) ferredoxin domain-containing protein [Symploca sp. SIO1C2]NER46234.1 (2Fe-2S) ferredoxin domain-containing protein [Symploca sp. SIO1A3]NER94349.1 (2Fe-2S) ferredoxin domain-containing protein [Symploca sp. SIO1B1]